MKQPEQILEFLYPEIPKTKKKIRKYNLEKRFERATRIVENAFNTLVQLCKNETPHMFEPMTHEVIANGLKRINKKITTTIINRKININCNICLEDALGFKCKTCTFRMCRACDASLERRICPQCRTPLLDPNAPWKNDPAWVKRFNSFTMRTRNGVVVEYELGGPPAKAILDWPVNLDDLKEEVGDNIFGVLIVHCWLALTSEDEPIDSAIWLFYNLHRTADFLNDTFFRMKPVTERDLVHCRNWLEQNDN